MTTQVGESFVGRRAELDELREGIAAANARRGSLVMLSGEPGIGKTRLAEATAEYARSAGPPGATYNSSTS